MLNNTTQYTLFLISHTCNPRTQPCDSYEPGQPSFCSTISLRRYFYYYQLLFASTLLVKIVVAVPTEIEGSIRSIRNPA